jgi:hypothetical protein
MTKDEKKARKILAKAVAAELRRRAKGVGWKASQGSLFREDDGMGQEMVPTFSWHANRLAGHGTVI